jgi:hypothetical protein
MRCVAKRCCTSESASSGRLYCQVSVVKAGRARCAGSPVPGSAAPSASGRSSLVTYTLSSSGDCCSRVQSSSALGMLARRAQARRAADGADHRFGLAEEGEHLVLGAVVVGLVRGGADGRHQPLRAPVAERDQHQRLGQRHGTDDGADVDPEAARAPGWRDRPRVPAAMPRRRIQTAAFPPHPGFPDEFMFIQLPVDHSNASAAASRPRIGIRWAAVPIVGVGNSGGAPARTGILRDFGFVCLSAEGGSFA